MQIHPEIRTVCSPYEDGEELVAMPAIPLDAAFVHMNRADAAGNGQFLGPDLYFDDLYLMAARRRFLTCERIVETRDLSKAGSFHTLRIQRHMVDGVIETPGGAHFTECPPDYGRDEAFQRRYADAARDEAAWADFRGRYLDVDEADYQRAVRESRGEKR
jgi:glutaconate CoA-transferase subunit A